ncbi:hypothetical protein HX886_07105 [Pseudomonas gingeri]|uniref:Uncharacterized protein n=2 Tax=Pseudomonas gingeri TaxID=117681 RepID=A0A7Y7YAF9_9PSED|nr:hypothetical protein [Pseudomonas gingeri]NWC32740.1 hypothetical protein [Pseudomonas gingeri]NWD07086.1 hypothetical protein [Pseudomonas gingeri]NWD51755.1 hypothetical protein [Pseudomonas gingeri]NWE31685.1 hypothetical protein [Pseudomonas gingeri]
MDIERYRYQGHWGIVFHVNRFIVHPVDRIHLHNLYFCEARTAQYEVARLVVRLYEKMLAKDLPCLMKIAFSQPLTREQGDGLNEQRFLVAKLISAAFGAMGTAAPGRYVTKLFANASIAVSTNSFIKEKLPTYHAGDIIVSLVAAVDGGIGPQQSSSSMILKSGR